MNTSVGLLILCMCLCMWQAHGTLNEYERAYMALPNRTLAREYLMTYTSAPHIAGSEGDYKTAEYTRDKLQSFGLEAKIVTHSMYANYPISRLLLLVNASTGDVIFQANMTEPAVEVDPTSNDTTVVPTFNGYSASGNTSAPLVFANYGQFSDFEALQKAGINMTGAVVIVKYGKVFRGVKAMKYGASGLLIYSDPADDGYIRAGGENNTYPSGPWRPEYGVQRGSVQYLPICPGSPSQERVKVCRGEAHKDDPFVGTLIPSIPVQPISWGDALPLLQSLAGTTAAPSDWNTKFLNYSLGPSSETYVKLSLVMNYTNVPIWNVIATLSGKRSDQIVLLGNHRDAWVFGATDPNSGSSAMLEVARSLALLKNTTGWVPERDIVFCSWDAEEYQLRYGLIGSTAWGELEAEYLQKSVIAYVNTDIGVSGSEYLDIGMTLSEFFDVPQLGILGSGSDYTVFLDHLGIPSLDIGYLNPFEAGVYHSIYDSFYWMDHFGDPGFIFHEGLAQLLGIVVIRLSDSPAHPFNFTNYAQQLSAYLQDIQGKAPPETNFEELEAAIIEFTMAADEIDSQSICATTSNCVSSLNLEALNTRLRLSERRLLLNAISNSSDDGLPYRPWYKHAIQAPGMHAGYGSQTFPGIMQGIIDNDPELIQEQIVKAASVVSNTASALTELSLSATVNPGCSGESLGRISKGGFTPVYYSVDGNNWLLLTTFDGLSTGSYSVYARDSEGLNASIVVNLVQSEKLQIEVELDKSHAIAVVTGGSGHYNITWSTDQTETEINLPKEGDYSVSVTDGNGCFASTTFSYKKEKKSISTGGVVGLVIAILVIIGVIVAGLYYIRRRNKTVHYLHL